ncbi:MAG: transcription termination/antitermination NusG family protein [Pseudomonadota bacterium]
MQEWFVLMTKPGRQDDVAVRLKGAGFNVFNPKLNQYSKKRSCYVVQPLFPLYMFVKLELLKDFKMIKYTRGVLRLIGVGREPHPIKEDIVLNIMDRCADGEIITAKFNCEEVQKGDRIQIVNGPLEGLEAVVSGVYNERQRVEILLQLMKISIDQKNIRKI